MNISVDFTKGQVFSKGWKHRLGASEGLLSGILRISPNLIGKRIFPWTMEEDCPYDESLFPVGTAAHIKNVNQYRRFENLEVCARCGASLTMIPAWDLSKNSGLCPQCNRDLGYEVHNDPFHKPDVRYSHPWWLGGSF